MANDIKEISNGTELFKVTYDKDKLLVSARDLHEFLEVKTKFKDWFPRMCEYGFSNGEDFNFLKIERVGFEGDREVKREVDDAALSIDMAKEICMLQRSERGKQARLYFLKLEKEWNSPEKVMARALKFAQEELEIMRPKAEYFDELCDRNALISIRDTAKMLGVPQNRFVYGLLTLKWLFRDARGQLRAYSTYVNNGYLTQKERTQDQYGKWSSVQTFVTFSGRDALRELIQTDKWYEAMRGYAPVRRAKQWTSKL